EGPRGVAGQGRLGLGSSPLLLTRLDPRIETPRRCRGVGWSARSPLGLRGLLAGAFLAGAFLAVALGAATFVVVFGATLALAVVVDLAGAAAASTVPVVASAFAAASARAVFESAVRALPAAVWAPFALSALPAAMRLRAAFAAWALLVCFVTRPEVWTWAPPVAALNFSVRRDLRRAAAFGWIAPAFAARSSAAWATASAAAASAPSPLFVAASSAFAT